jgi:ferredoxin-NADP reductase
MQVFYRRQFASVARFAMFPRPNHAERTADEPRDDRVYEVAISDSKIENASGSVKSFAFRFIDPSDVQRFGFRPGQWLDVFIPEQQIVGGYSLISAPQEISEAKAFDLAIKGSSHPPARWFHQEARVGSEVAVRTGGSYFFPPLPSIDFEEVVFLTAGVGINPILSMLGYIKRMEKPPRVKLLYSSKMDELLFLDRIESLLPLDQVRLFITQPGQTKPPLTFRNVHNRRFDIEDVKKAITDPSKTLIYLCGPAQMTDEYEELLCGKEGIGFDRNRLFLEKWW